MAKIHPTSYEYVIPISTHKGKTYGEVAEIAPQHLDWLAGQLAFPENIRVAAAMTRFGQAIDKVPNLIPKSKYGAKVVEARQHSFTIRKPELWMKAKSQMIMMRFPTDDELKERLKRSIDGFRWDDGEFAWTFAPGHLPELIGILGGPKKIALTVTVKAAYIEEIKRRSALNAIHTKSDSELDIPTLLELFKYQKVAIEFALKTKIRFILADQMGLGKTPTVIGIAELKNAKTLITCPKGSKRTVWERQIKMFAGKDCCIWDNDGYEGDLEAQYHIIHYDAVKKQLPELLKIKFDLLACDEAHKLKNHKSIRAKAVLGYYPERATYPGIQTKWIIFATGTPLLNRPIELFTLLHKLDPKEFANAKTFIDRYGGRNSDDPPRNLDELFKRIRKYMIRRLTKNIRKDAPQKQRFDYPVELTPAQLDAYVKFETKMLKHSRGGVSAAQMPAFRNFLFEIKFPILCKFVEEMNDSGRGVLIWTIQVEHAERIAEYFGKNKIRIYHGGLTAKVADQNIRDLQDGKVQNAVFTIGKGAESIDGLQHHMDAEMFVDEWFVPGINEQAEDRLNRVGQKNALHVWYMVCMKTIDELMRAFVAEKQKVIDTAVDGGEVVKARTTSVMKDVWAEMARRRQLQIDLDHVEEEDLAA